MAARLWTAGWDFVAPTKIIGYHLWTRKHRPVFREHACEQQRHREAASKSRVRQLLGIAEATEGGTEDNGEGGAVAADVSVSGRCGLGIVRTLAEYEKFCGVNPSKRKISLRARRGGLKATAFVDGDPAATPSATSSTLPSMQGTPLAAALGAPILGLMPGNVAAAIRALAGPGPGDGAAVSPTPTAVDTSPASATAAFVGKAATAAVSSSASHPPPRLAPPKLLRLSEKQAGRLQLLRPGDIEAFNTQGFVVIDGFLEKRGYSACGTEHAAEAPLIVRAGATKVPVRSARLGRGERLWSSAVVRGDEMTWLSAPQGDGLRNRAERRVLAGLGSSPSFSGGVEFDALAAELQGAFGSAGAKPRREAEKPEVLPEAAGADGAMSLGSDSPIYEDLDVYLAKILELRGELDDLLGFSTARTSLMLAKYPGGGARYARHLDATSQQTGEKRRITAVYYLNEHWKAADGGCLRAYFPEDVGRKVRGAVPVAEIDDSTPRADPVLTGLWALDVEPRMDRLVVFASGWLEHEVLPSHSERYAITAWFY